MARQPNQIDFFSQYTPPGADTGESERLQGLSNVFGQIREMATQELSVRSEAEGRKEAIRDVEAGEVDERSDFTVRGQAYNQAALLGHRARVRRDTRETLARLQNEYGDDPDAFRNAAEGYRQGVTEEMPEELAFAVGQDIDDAISTTASLLQQAEYEQQEKENLAAINEEVEAMQDDITNAARFGDESRVVELQTQLEALQQGAVESGLATPEQARAQTESIRERVEVQRALGGADKILNDESIPLEDRAVRGQAFVDSIRDTQIKNLSAEQKDKLVNSVQAKVNQAGVELAQRGAEKNIETEREISNLKIAANTGSGDPSEIVTKTEDLFDRGSITESERTSIFTNLAKNQQKVASQAIKDSEVSKKISGDDAIVLEKKDIDSYYERILAPSINEMPAGERQANQAHIVNRLKTIPSSLKAQTLNNLRSENPDLIRESAELIDRIDSIPGLVDRSFTPNDRAFAEQVVQLSQNMPPEAAVLKAREITSPQNKSRVEGIEETIKGNDLREEYPDIVKSDFTGMFTESVIPADQLPIISKEYGDLFEAHFKAGMSEDSAKDKALELLKRNWAASPTSNNRVVKYPVEQYYQVGGDTGYIKDQLIKDVNENFNIGRFIKGEEIFLQPHPNTGREASTGRPTYQVVIQTEELGLTPLTGFKWAPDMESESKRLEDENREMIINMRSHVPNLLSEEVQETLTRVL